MLRLLLFVCLNCFLFAQTYQTPDVFENRIPLPDDSQKVQIGNDKLPAISEEDTLRSFFSRYGVSVGFGGGSGEESWSEFNILFGPLVRTGTIAFRARILLVRSREQFDEFDRPGRPRNLNSSNSPTAIFQVGRDFRNLGIWIGTFINPQQINTSIYANRIDTNAKTSRFWPSARFNLGNLDRFYFSFHLFEDSLDPLSIGINFRNKTKIPFLWIGYIQDEFGQQLVSAKIEIESRQTNRFYLKLAYAEGSPTIFGFRIGYTFAIHPR